MGNQTSPPLRRRVSNEQGAIWRQGVLGLTSIVYGSRHSYNLTCGVRILNGCRATSQCAGL